ncbi:MULTISPECIES: ABC transporter ATP-binding protein [Desulfococcus]|uniref:ABC transporter related protein n=1 Tax=Desulfococcus multivorans DSM 2059 TaxID=1121405 RepID=S7TLK6_DESML|nr:ATP-binding cassette domain-containing protein [Desulfococcus multivorans]AOY58702.1 putative ABC transporter, ATP-binding protein [Desulfococcus multivorans]AQV00988.1 hypothetical protein B2D07_09565 [Desulfococcus multivorans]EPR37746.1 ABC transporter related protein [Desulfococcus multivorans DSM 2059]SJZ46594.1 energy-coupling factor transport system ATP-binding protein [Desulfococcus multivorans DSM 2059]
MTRRESFIAVAGLRYAYGKETPWILKDVDLEIPPGEHLLVAGASGSGKSTLARTLNGLIPHFYGGRLEGEVRVGGESTRDRTVADLFDQVGMVFQNPEAQLFNRTVRREIAFGLESLGLPRREMLRRIDGIAAETGIGHLLSRAPHQLSGGEQQMVCISAVAALKPKMIVLDEPFANLDGENVARIRKTLVRLGEKGTGVMVCEHRLGYAGYDAARMVVLADGRKVLDGPAKAVLSRDLGVYGLEAPTCGQASGLGASGYEIRPEAPGRGAAGDRQPIIELDGVSFERGGRRIIDNVSLSIDRGECVAIVGPNGAGKTTLLKLFNGLFRPVSGRVLLNGKDIRKEKVSRLARHVGMAFQNPSGQFFKLTVWDEITVAAKTLNRYDPEWIDTLIRLFRLGDLVTRPPYRLSSGEKKRTAFAAALSARPDILILDEPTSGQDRHFKNALSGFLAELQEQGQTVVLVTHDLGFAETCAPRWLYLDGGRIIAQGAPRRVSAGSCPPVYGAGSEAAGLCGGMGAGA